MMLHVDTPNEAAPPNPAEALRFQVEHPWRRVGEPRRSAVKVVVVVLASLLVQYYALAGIETDISPTNRTILKSESWTPTAKQIKKTLPSIQSFLDKPATTNRLELAEIKKVSANIKHYRVQFLGVVRDGRKIILCNFFPAWIDDGFRDWRTRKIEVEDGGFWFWEIDYDLRNGKCSNFRSNGYSGGHP